MSQTLRFSPSLSIEVEPPQIHSRQLEHQEILKFTNSIHKMAPSIDFISVTNRPTFRMSSISTMKLILSSLRDSRNAAHTFPILHLTTRLSIYDTYNELLDARRLGIEHLLPVLGDPRGPKTIRFFKHSLDMLAFIKGISNPELFEQLYTKSPSLQTTAAAPIDDATFFVGSVLDPNETHLRNGKEVNIRAQQLELFKKRKALGADYFITQAVFDPFQALSFLDKVSDTRIPIGIGLIPPTFTIANLIGVPLPKEIATRLKKKTSKKGQYDIALEIAAENYQVLRDHGVQWIHIYCLGRPSVFFSIVQGK